jgi:hypothetical protein
MDKALKKFNDVFVKVRTASLLFLSFFFQKFNRKTQDTGNKEIF